LEKQGEDLRQRISAVLQGKLGFADAGLMTYGVVPKKKRVRSKKTASQPAQPGTATTSPASPAPPPPPPAHRPPPPPPPAPPPRGAPPQITPPAHPAETRGGRKGPPP